MCSHRLLCFNCSNEMALAANVKQYTPPKNIARMEADWSLLPMWWAEEGDAIIVSDDSASPKHSSSKLDSAFGLHENSSFLISNSSLFLTTWSEGYDALCQRAGHEFVPSPWGWSKAIVEKFRRFGVPERLLPSDQYIADVRAFASREFAVSYITTLLSAADTAGWGHHLIGREMRFVTDENFSLTHLSIVKSPWSSSGRGVFIANPPLSPTDERRCKKFLKEQGGFVLDRFYDKTLDFALEFEVKTDGTVVFLGYSVFEAAVGGRYGGNVVADQRTLRGMIDAALLDTPVGVVDWLIEYHCSSLAASMGGRYVGVVGIDLLVDRLGLVHPCIEINVRMNMGVVAINRYERLGDNKETMLTPESKHGFNAIVLQNQ